MKEAGHYDESARLGNSLQIMSDNAGNFQAQICQHYIGDGAAKTIGRTNENWRSKEAARRFDRTLVDIATDDRPCAERACCGREYAGTATYIGDHVTALQMFFERFHTKLGAFVAAAAEGDGGVDGKPNAAARRGSRNGGRRYKEFLANQERIAI